ncbi:MAG: hypothetical protein HY051_06080 [Candidatus Aenigmarchaeota archaeon]|nr:hypothetical protein [Candidatus Aenigmarchaeota archaeon]
METNKQVLNAMEFEDATNESVRGRIEEFYREHPEKTLKTLIFKAYGNDGEEFLAVVIRGDLRISFDRLKQELDLVKIRFATKEEMKKLGLTMGYISPIDCKSIKIIGDKSITENKNYYDGGNKPFLYRKNVNYPRDFQVWKMLDVSS